MINQSPIPELTDVEFQALSEKLQKIIRGYATLRRMVKTLIPRDKVKLVMEDSCLLGMALLSFCMNTESKEIRKSNLGSQAAENLYNRFSDFYRDYLDFYC